MTALRRQHRNRRGSEQRDFVWLNRRYTAGFSRFDDGTLAEVFLDCGKAGAEVQLHAQDSAVLVSLLLQYGVPPAVIRHSIVGPIGRALDLIEAEK